MYFICMEKIKNILNSLGIIEKQTTDSMTYLQIHGYDNALADIAPMYWYYRNRENKNSVLKQFTR